MAYKDLSKHPIIGKEFDFLVIKEVFSKAEKHGRRLYGRCECKCGRMAEASLSNLVRHSVKSCGCQQHAKGILTKPFRPVPVGKRYEMLEVIGEAEVEVYCNSKTGKVQRFSRSLLRCDCGREVVKRNSELRYSPPVSCGCRLFTKNRAGEKHHRLTVKSYAGKGYWLCACSCGGETKVASNNLRRQKSCGCATQEYYNRNKRQ